LAIFLSVFYELSGQGDEAYPAAPESYRFLTGLIQQMQSMSAHGSISYRGATGQGRQCQNTSIS